MSLNELNEGVTFQRTSDRAKPKGPAVQLADDWKITEEDMIRILRRKAGEAYADDDMARASRLKKCVLLLEGHDIDLDAPAAPVYRTAR